MMNEIWGKIHFFLTFIFFNGTFFTMHILGAGGFPRRLADPYHYDTFRHLQPHEPVHDHLRIWAWGRRRSSSRSTSSTACSSDRKCGRNPWHANSLEWIAPSPPGHGNFDFQPIVYRGPYEYGSPEVDTDYYPQTQPPPPGVEGHEHDRRSRACTLIACTGAIVKRDLVDNVIH